MRRIDSTRVAAIALLVSFAMFAVGCSSADHGSADHGSPDQDSMTAPGDDSVEAGFARDMSVHHAQAVAMAEAIRDRTADPDLKLLATDIALGQQNQIGRMTGWLDEWGLSVGTTREAMAWMAGGDMPGGEMTGDQMNGSPAGELDPVTGLMPGMASRPQISALATLPIEEAEISFLQLMIAHHVGGVSMAEAALALTDRPDVVRLGTSIVNGQQAEIDLMTDMLAKRGVTS